MWSALEDEILMLRQTHEHKDKLPGIRLQDGIVFTAGLEEAVQLARQEAREGDIVSLSPASASFDRYKNFEARGRHYKQLVEGL